MFVVLVSDWLHDQGVSATGYQAQPHYLPVCCDVQLTLSPAPAENLVKLYSLVVLVYARDTGPHCIQWHDCANVVASGTKSSDSFILVYCVSLTPVLCKALQVTGVQCYVICAAFIHDTREMQLNKLDGVSRRRLWDRVFDSALIPSTVRQHLIHNVSVY